MVNLPYANMISKYMGAMKDEHTKPEEVEFFKIDEATYDPKTLTWGSDWLIANDNYHTVTIPSDIKAGTYIVRHELVALHGSFNQNDKTKQSGAQFYPQCVKVKVLGDGTATPPGEKIPGVYKWDDPGVLVNIYYGPNQYISPGPAVYKGKGEAPKGSQPVVTETGVLTGELGAQYKLAKDKSIKSFEDVVHADSDNKHGGGGCHWEVGAEPSTAKCVPTNPDMPQYAGFAQPKGSPMYVDKPAGQAKGTGPPITNLFDPTKGKPTSPQKRDVAVEFQG
jgi:hypothetical protein